MAKKFSERMQGLAEKLSALGAKAEAAAGDARAAWELRDNFRADRISTAKGNVAALEETIRIEGEKQKGRLSAALLRAKMTRKARAEDRREARDKRNLEVCIVRDVDHALDCYEAAALLVAEAELSILEATDAAAEYMRRFGEEPVAEGVLEDETGADAGEEPGAEA